MAIYSTKPYKRNTKAHKSIPPTTGFGDYLYYSVWVSGVSALTGSLLLSGVDAILISRYRKLNVIEVEESLWIFRMGLIVKNYNYLLWIPFKSTDDEETIDEMFAAIRNSEA